MKHCVTVTFLTNISFLLEMFIETTGVYWKWERKSKWRSVGAWAGPCSTDLLYLYSRSLWFTTMSYYKEFELRKWHLRGGGGPSSAMSTLKGSSSFFLPTQSLQCRCCETWHPRKARGPWPSSKKSYQMTATRKMNTSLKHAMTACQRRGGIRAWGRSHSQKHRCFQEYRDSF